MGWINAYQIGVNFLGLSKSLKSDAAQQQADLIAKQVYLDNYPFQGLYAIQCNSTTDTDCLTSCQNVFPEQTPLYKNRLEAMMESIPEKCVFDVTYDFDDIPTLSTSRTYETAAVAIDPVLFPLLNDLNEIVKIRLRVFYEDNGEDEPIPPESRVSVSDSMWSLGRWTSLPSGAGECGSLASSGPVKRVGGAESCYTDDLNADTILRRDDCKSMGSRMLKSQLYDLNGLDMTNITFGRTEDVVAWNRQGAPEPVCIVVRGQKIGLASSATLTGSAKVFDITGGAASQLVPTHTRHIQDCDSCLRKGYHWCKIGINLQRDQNYFDPIIPIDATSGYSFPPSESCYMNPLLCPGTLQTCQGKVAALPGYQSAAQLHFGIHTILNMYMIYILIHV